VQSTYFLNFFLAICGIGIFLKAHKTIFYEKIMCAAEYSGIWWPKTFARSWQHCSIVTEKLDMAEEIKEQLTIF
jgi:hypothetical protein